MTDIKRVRYATGQFLTATDFTREQTYHITLRRAHNRNLHSWGVAIGLDVTKVDDTHVAVSAGEAIDPGGDEIVLLDPVTLDLSAQATQYLYLIATYQEISDPADKVEIGGADAFVAVTERPAFSFVAPGLDTNGAVNPPPVGAVALALLTLDTGKIATIDNTIRKAAGPATGPVFAVQTLDASADVIAAGTVNAGGGSVLFSGAPTGGFDARANILGNALIQNSNTSQTLEIYGHLNDAPGSLVGTNRYIALYEYVQVYGGMHFQASPTTSSLDGSIIVDGGLQVAKVSTFAGMLIVQGTLEGGSSVLHDLIVITDVQVSRNLQVNGDLTLDNTLIAPKKGGLVMDRFVNALADPVEIGDVVVIGAGAPSLSYGPDGMIPVPEVDLTDVVADTRVCGVVCEVHGDNSGEEGAMRRFSEDERQAGTPHQVLPGQLGHMVVLGSYAFCKVDADIAPIAAGDLLTTSSTPGHAQKVLDRTGAIGAIVGKALAPLAGGKGKIPVIVTLQ